MARIEGVADARFVLDSNGRSKTGAYAGHPLLVAGVKKLIESSQLVSSCAGSEYRLTYRFEIRGKPGFPLKESVSFRAPDEFVVQSNPPGLMVEQSTATAK
jgi:hypothetical protein